MPSPRTSGTFSVPRLTLYTLLLAMLIGILVAAGSVSLTPATADAAQPKRVKAVKKATGCRRPAPTTAAGHDAMFDRLGGSFAAGDQATSVLLPDGRLLWLFNDTIQGTRTAAGGVKNWRMPHNTLGISDKGCMSIHTGKNRSSLIPEARNGEYYWPTSAVFDAGKLYVFNLRVRATKGWFVGVGTELAQLTYVRGGTPSFRRMHRTPSTGTPETRVQWGTAATTAGGFHYVYGTQKVNQPLVFGKALYVARVPVGRLTNLAAWRYWNGRTWATRGAKAIRPAGGGVSTTLTVHKIGARWVAVTKKDEMVGTDIVTLTAPSPVGPWTERVVAKAPSKMATGDVTYSVMAHPTVKLRSGKLLVSVCRNNLNPAKIFTNVERAQPYFLEVDLRR